MGTLPVISSMTAGIIMILQIVLMMTTALGRGKNKQSLGDGGKEPMLRLIRRHGNLAENSGLFIACFGLLEMLGTNRTLVLSLCGAFILARLSHAIALSMENTVGLLRLIGAAGTMIVGLITAGFLIKMAAPFFL